MRTIFVGDLHGKHEIAQYILTHNTNDKIIFVGDYLDSFDRSIEDQVKTLEIVLEATKAEPERVIVLRGNHEYSYLKPQQYACSGFKQATLIQIKRLLPDVDRCTLDSYKDESSGALVTHAGVTEAWRNMISPINNGLEEVLLLASEADWNMVGKSRGGIYPCGGPVWCDYWAEFKSIPGVKQVFGHTQYRAFGIGHGRGVVSEDGENFNVDCLNTSDEVLVWSPELGFYPIDYRDL
jgi:hypothetical protein